MRMRCCWMWVNWRWTCLLRTVYGWWWRCFLKTLLVWRRSRRWWAIYGALETVWRCIRLGAMRLRSSFPIRVTGSWCSGQGLGLLTVIYWYRVWYKVSMRVRLQCRRGEFRFGSRFTTFPRKATVLKQPRDRLSNLLRHTLTRTSLWRVCVTPYSGSGFMSTHHACYEWAFVDVFTEGSAENCLHVWEAEKIMFQVWRSWSRHQDLWINSLMTHDCERRWDDVSFA